MGALRAVFHKHLTGRLILLHIKGTAGDLQHRFSVAPAFLGFLLRVFSFQVMTGPNTSLRARFTSHLALLRFAEQNEESNF